MIEYTLCAIDRHFAKFIRSEADIDFPQLEVLAALLSNAVASGDTCLDLYRLADSEIMVDGDLTVIPPYVELQQLLSRSGVVGCSGAYYPLILDQNGRLYLYRYWQYEHALAQTLVAKAADCVEFDEATLCSGLERLFPADNTSEIDWQQVATVAALRKKFTVISGGPGTGKTSTVVKIIALLLEQPSDHPERIALAAPTGKAAARLKESISQMKVELNCAATVKDAIPTDVLTIHRLLGYIHGSVQFRFNSENCLPFDTVIIDEASMVPLTLMAKLVAALKPSARLILLGDRDQLASVEAGAVLGAISGNGDSEPFSLEFLELLIRLTATACPFPTVSVPTPLVDTLVVLKKNYRFGDDSRIANLGQAINVGNGEQAFALLGGTATNTINWQNIPAAAEVRNKLREIVLAGYQDYLTAPTPAAALSKFEQFRILCMLRLGEFGVERINAQVEAILASAGLINLQQRWYHGRPVMITVNDYNLQLFNGDIGITFYDHANGDSPQVCFTTASGEIRTIPAVRLPQHETVYVMTVHKSQGSEFEQLLLLLPNYDSENLTRELIYTAVTRARSKVTIWGEKETFISGVVRRTNRSSGLGHALWPVNA